MRILCPAIVSLVSSYAKIGLWWPLVTRAASGPNLVVLPEADPSSRFALLRMTARGSDAAQTPSLDDLGDGSRSYGPAALADSEAQTLLHGHRRLQLNLELHVVARH